MDSCLSNWNDSAALQEMLGYLNFSTGKPDSRFQRNLNEWFRAAQDPEPWTGLDRALRARLDELHGTSAAFRDVRQAEAILGLVFHNFLALYRAHHSDLLFHLSDRALFQPFFLARVFEAMLAEGGPWEQVDRILKGTLERLNDFVGHRPVAVLERKLCEPYDHERVRPIPLYIRGAGVASGAYHDIVAATLEILGRADPAILAEAQFDLDALDELALDPRAYDYGHPVNQRPNYQFGEWDPHAIDNAGKYRRFVVRQVTLDALVARVRDSQGSGLRVQGSGFGVQQDASTPANAVFPLPERRTLSPEPSSAEPRTLNSEHSVEPFVLESAAVLAGTILMAAGTSGSGPDAYDSSVTLATLVPRIARYRDRFYEQLLQSIPGRRGDELRREAEALRQPFGGARQHLNRHLARQRALQLQNVRLAALFGAMGYPQASAEHARKIPTGSARILCEIDIRITDGLAHLRRGELSDSLRLISEVEEWMRRGIACGAIVDPWNILGFQGQFSIFAARENSVPDPRIEQLTALMEASFSFYAELLAESASRAEREVESRTTAAMGKLAEWWDRFATTEVSGVRRVHGAEAVQAATHVARALALWHQGGEAAGDIKFWRKHSDGFNSPRAYDQVVRALIRKNDHVAALALLISWVGQSTGVPLEQGTYSFYQVCLDWLRSVIHGVGDSKERWTMARKFFDYLEANAEEYWRVPTLTLSAELSDPDRGEDSDADKEGPGDDEPYAAAYEDVSYRDSAADGHEGEVIDGSSLVGEFPLEAAAERIEPRLKFLTMLASLWQLAADIPTSTATESQLGSSSTAGSSIEHPEQIPGSDPYGRVLNPWLHQLQRNQRDLEKLLNDLQQTEVPGPLGSYDALVEYDRRRSIKEHLIELAVDALVETSTATRRVLRSLAETPADGALTPWEHLAVQLDRVWAMNELDAVRAHLAQLLAELAKVPVLYRRWDRGGHPREIVAVRNVQQVLRSLVESLPRSGLLRETYHVLRTAREMERSHPIQGEAVTEFDHLFRTAIRAVIECVLHASRDWMPNQREDAPLLECLEELSEPFLKLWLEHSQSLRLSSLDRIQDDAEWGQIRQFIEKYGHDLLTPKFLTPGNLRAVADQGAARYLDWLAQDQDPLHPVRLINDLGSGISRQSAGRLLDLIVQIFLENYEEYSDYNTTTTQSDYGERFFNLIQFLGIKSRYERTHWNLQPVALVHELLARHGRVDAAHRWQEAMDEKIAETADRIMHELAQLESETGVRLATVRDRLGDRFTRSLAVDRARALVARAVQEALENPREESREALRHMCEEIHEFLETPSGVGLDTPRWLRSLETEVARERVKRDALPSTESSKPIERQPISREALSRQLAIWNDPL